VGTVGKWLPVHYVRMGCMCSNQELMCLMAIPFLQDIVVLIPGFEDGVAQHHKVYVIPTRNLLMKK
jgi:hypothetical protein